MIDSGAADDKIIAIPFNDPTYNSYTDIEQLPRHIFDEMSHFFSVYKALENKDTAIDEIRSRQAATEIIEKTIERYIEYYCK